MKLSIRIIMPDECRAIDLNESYSFDSAVAVAFGIYVGWITAEQETWESLYPNIHEAHRWNDMIDNRFVEIVDGDSDEEHKIVWSLTDYLADKIGWKEINLDHGFHGVEM